MVKKQGKFIVVMVKKQGKFCSFMVENQGKTLVDPKTNQIIGAGITCPDAGDLISELALAIEKNCTAKDLSHTIHPHPTLSETTMMAAEVFEGTVTDLLNTI